MFADVNECDESPCSPDATCTNTDGSYQCTCNAGYTGSGKGNNGCTIDSSATSGPMNGGNSPIAKVSVSPIINNSVLLQVIIAFIATLILM